jgi:hypothetical protein
MLAPTLLPSYTLTPNPSLLHTAQYRVELRFGAVTLSKPTHSEPGEDKPEDLFPNPARLRNLT